MTDLEMTDIQKAHDLAIAYTTHVLNARKPTADIETFYHEYEDAYENFIILICRRHQPFK